MNFDYAAAKGRIMSDLEAVVNELESASPEKKSAWPERDVISRARNYSHKSIHDLNEKEKKMQMLMELSSENYWRISNYWADISNNISKEDQELYLKTAIDLARKDTESRCGNVWIIENYDKGLFREQISDEFLKDCVTRGFFEFANNYLIDTAFSATWEWYELLMKYSDKIDLSKVSELKGKKPFTCRNKWINKTYLSAIKRAEDKAPVEDIAWLIRPVVEAILYERHERDWIDNDQVIKKLAEYKQYLDTLIIQDLFKAHIIQSVNDFRSDSSEALMDFDLLSSLINMPSGELRSLVADHIEFQNYAVKCYVNNRIPPYLLNKESRSKIKKIFLEEVLPESRPDWIRKGRREIFPNLSLLETATEDGWVKTAEGRKIIRQGVNDYLNSKKAFSASETEYFLSALDKKFVDPKVYKSVLKKAITTLRFRKREKEADYWKCILENKPVPKLKSEEEVRIHRVKRRKRHSRMRHRRVDSYAARTDNSQSTIEKFF